uniref:Uncharacterized protein n=1 Tax=Pristionchus pacificus TaxID=54126 RepID=A0A2A6B4M4_PRIPA|eukprot:PDM60822.1 hypothetical protein PRIPAC_54628 [Pristionchus pacificus]
MVSSRIVNWNIANKAVNRTQYDPRGTLNDDDVFRRRFILVLRRRLGQDLECPTTIPDPRRPPQIPVTPRSPPSACPESSIVPSCSAKEAGRVLGDDLLDDGRRADLEKMSGGECTYMYGTGAVATITVDTHPEY